MKMPNKKINLLFVLGMVFSATMFSSCRSPEKKVDDAAENVTDAKNDLTAAQEDYAAEVEKFRTESSDKITSNEKEIADLRAKMINEKKVMKEEYNRKVDAMEAKNAEMKKRLDDYHDEGNDKWQSFKTEFNHDMDEFRHALKDFTVNNKK